MAQASKFCRACKAKTLHKSEGFWGAYERNMGHGCLIVATCGLWIPIALIAGVFNNVEANKMRCQRCGQAN